MKVIKLGEDVAPIKNIRNIAVYIPTYKVLDPDYDDFCTFYRLDDLDDVVKKLKEAREEGAKLCRGISIHINFPNQEYRLSFNEGRWGSIDNVNTPEYKRITKKFLKVKKSFYDSLEVINELK